MVRFEAMVSWLFGCLAVVFAILAIAVVPSTAFGDAGGSAYGAACLAQFLGSSTYNSDVGSCCADSCNGSTDCMASCCDVACREGDADCHSVCHNAAPTTVDCTDPNKCDKADAGCTSACVDQPCRAAAKAGHCKTKMIRQGTYSCLCQLDPPPIP